MSNGLGDKKNKRGKKRTSPESYFYLEACFQYHDEQNMMSAKENLQDRSINMIGHHDPETGKINFYGDSGPFTTLIPISIEPQHSITISYNMDIDHTAMKPLTLDIMESTISWKEIIQSIYNTYRPLLHPSDFEEKTFTCEGTLRYSLEDTLKIPVTYHMKKQYRSEWHIESITFSIAKAVWNDQMSHISRQVDLLKSRDKSKYLKVK